MLILSLKYNIVQKSLKYNIAQKPLVFGAMSHKDKDKNRF